MTLLVRQNRTYERVYHDREDIYTAIVKTELRKILPDFIILDFSPYVIGEEGVRRKPDLALVDKTYSLWAVVEVELEKHPLKRHVLPQVQTFVTGRYGQSHASYLHQKDPSLNIDSLSYLVVYVQPEVLVIVNSRTVLNEGWGIIESEYSANLTFLETYRSNDDDVIVEVSGYIPARQHHQAIQLKKHKMLNALVCTRPRDFTAISANVLPIYWGERLYIWRIQKTMDTVLFLTPSGFQIRPDRNYELLHIGEHKYRLRLL